MADDEPTVCGRCGEPVRFVEGLSGGDRWRHVRTGMQHCAPVCRVCGEPATTRIGSHASHGDGSSGFQASGWLCDRHAASTLRIAFL